MLNRFKPMLWAPLSLALFAAYSPSLTAQDDSALAWLESQFTGIRSPTKNAQGEDVYIVRFREAPLAQYQGENPRFARPARNEHGRLNTRSSEARAYVAHLRGRQEEVLAEVATRIGRNPQASMRFTHAINGVALGLSEQEALLMAASPDVLSVERSMDIEADTDVGPGHIGAPTLWDGSNSLTGATRAEGVVIGVIDSGINFASPSFATVEPASGYVHENPLGSGVALGTCATGGVDEGLCTDKLIAAYDFVYSAVCNPANPATDPCRTTGGGTIAEEPSAVDNNGHGTHTASTAGGNAHALSILDGRTISGVAPRATIIAYDACYTRVSDGAGLCPFVSTLAGIEQAIADGLVDVINYSIGGGQQPWSETGSQAFLSATEAGIFVAASAGNSGPNPNTMGHHEPWTTSVAALTHTRGAFIQPIEVNDQDAVLAPQSFTVRPSLSSAAYTGQADAPSVELKLSPALQAAADPTPVTNDLCTAVLAGIPAGHFTGTIALVRRGGCTFAEKAANATTRGALGIVIFNNDAAAPAAPLGLSLVPSASIPAWGATTNDGVAMFAYIKANPALTRVAVGALSSAAVVPDSVASFSSRGPNPFALLKPDLGAPGVDVLAAYSGAANSYNVISGTSMASPHVAGAAALLRSLNPGRTPMQIKSSMLLTARTAGVTREDGITAATPFDRGAGVIDLTRAAKSGLILDETATNFSAANPATGGDPAQLNLASFQNGLCAGVCTFTRTVRAGRSASGVVRYNLTVEGLPPGVASTDRAFINVSSGNAPIFILSIDGEALSTTEYSFGALVLTPDEAGFETLRMPIAVKGAPPEINITPASLEAEVLVGGGAVTVDLTVQNLGNAGLEYDARTSGTAWVVTVNQPYENSGSGLYSSRLTNSLVNSQYIAEDFVVGADGMTITRIEAQGFPTAGSLAANATALSVFVFPDAAGSPSGDPQVNPGTAVFSFTTTTGPGVSVANNTISIDLVAAGQTANLPTPGTYWVVVYPDTPLANRWNWFVNVTSYGASAKFITPAGADTAWRLLSQFGFNSMALRMERLTQCGAPWITNVTNQSGTLDTLTDATLEFTLDSTGLDAGIYEAFVCVDSNDLDEPITVVPVTFTVSELPTDIILANALAAPDTVGVGDSTLLTVEVTPGMFPDSSGLTVNADLSALGGNAVEPMVDDGSNGDVTAGDNVYSTTAIVGVGTPIGPASVAVSAIDDQARADTAQIDLTIVASTGIVLANGLATPDTVLVGGNTLLTVEVTPGTFPDSSGLSVTADLSPLGGSASEPMLDDGLNGDETAGDGVYSVNANVAIGTAIGPASITVSAIDDQARSDTTQIDLTVEPTSGISAEGASTPAYLIVGGGNVLFTVTVTPGIGPASTDIEVEADLQSIGGSAAQAFFDDGSNGDETAGDNVFSFAYSVPAETAVNTYPLAVSISDAEMRTAETSVPFSVRTREMFSNGFEAPPAD